MRTRAVSGWIHAARSKKGFRRCSGLAYGSRYWHMPLSAQCAMWLALLGATLAPLAALTQTWAFASACAVAGVAMAPPLIIQSTLVAKTVSARYATEGFT
jgi:hypothetical protein